LWLALSLAKVVADFVASQRSEPTAEASVFYRAKLSDVASRRVKCFLENVIQIMGSSPAKHNGDIKTQN
jgi:hypothetical protein